MTMQEQFLSQVEDYLAKSGLTPTKFGKEALDDPNFVFQLRRGRSCGLKIIDKVLLWISVTPPEKWKKDAA